MRQFTLFTGLVVLASVLGCSGSDTKLNTTPLTEEQKRQIQEQDRRIEDEERSGSGTASSRRGKQGSARPTR